MRVLSPEAEWFSKHRFFPTFPEIKHRSTARVENGSRLLPASYNTLRRCLQLRQNLPACAPWGRSVTWFLSLPISDRV
jgi:hypothetical protein